LLDNISSQTNTPLPSLRIEPPNRWPSLDVRELWEYRELLYFLTLRDIKIRYKQTVLGAAWAIIQPVFMMVVFSLFFGKLAKVDSDGIPYPVFAFCALLPWQLFAHAVSESSNSLVGNQNLINKVYFPRLVIPLSAVLSGLLDFLVAFVVLVGLMFWYGIVPGWRIITVPVFILFAMCTALAVGLWLSALSVQYRDVRYVIGFLVQIWLFATPVAYASRIIPERWRAVYALNPMAGVVEGFRWALLGKSSSLSSMLWVSVVVVLITLLGGLYYFRRMEQEFADIV
jgi:lipopolysaccharide transport system permease protein